MRRPGRPSSYRAFSGWTTDRDASLQAGHRAALKATACDPDDFWGYAVLSHAELFMHRHERAPAAANRALELSPNSADARALRGLVLNFMARPEQALQEMQIAARHNPHYPFWYHVGFGRAHYTLGRYEDAIPHAERPVAAGEGPLNWRLLLIACYTGAGRMDQARAEAAALLAAYPETRLGALRDIVPLQDEQALAQYLDLLRRAGLPE